MTTQTQQNGQAGLTVQAFIDRWQGRGGGERREMQSFWIDLLRVLGVSDPTGGFIEFEVPVHVGDVHGFIDGYIPETKVLIEQKRVDKDLRTATRQSDGSLLTPYQQAQRYANALSHDQHPRWIVTCNFAEFLVYDMNNRNAEPHSIRLADLAEEAYRLDFIVNARNANVAREMKVSFEAGQIVGRIYDALLAQYGEPTPEVLRWLNVLCVRLVFCLYAEDAGIFARNQFHDYLDDFEPDQCRQALIDLFKVLDTPVADRNRYLRPALRAFPYVNGGLFSGFVEIPQFTPQLVDAILRDASADFDWSKISPTIFGALFESTLDSKIRRSGGMHYTSIENIHKVIDPLFLDGLRADLDAILADPVERTRNARLEAYQNRLASLSFLDPACGSGNFLTETYLALRKLENRALRARFKGQGVLGLVENPVRVSIHQFHGIEINDFAVAVATTALWISEDQMLKATAEIVHHPIDFLPLKSYANIREGNALRMDWQPPETGPFDYIIGNPPFRGARKMDAGQKADLAAVFGTGWRNLGNLDYVSGWYKKAADYMADHPATRTALVSTNSVTQGEAPADLWKPLIARGIAIDFAHRSFVWDSESADMAHVHCVIVGFSCQNAVNRPAALALFDGPIKTLVPHINAYLTEGPDVYTEPRNRNLAGMPEIKIGNKPIDGGNYLFNREEMEDFIRREPAAAAYFRPWYGAEEFIHRKPRYCLWLGDCEPSVIRSMPLCRERVEAVRAYRLASTSAGTRRIADKPTRFHVENMPSGNYIVIPQVSSQRRRYIPIGFLTPDVLCSDKLRLMPDATLYHFGVLISNVHMAWMRANSCLLKNDYSYTVNIVYNNFPWPTPTADQQARIAANAQAILDARAAHPDCTLADLYDPVTMPPDLLEAHRANDKAVLAAYGLPVRTTEPECVAHLFGLYQTLAAAN